MAVRPFVTSSIALASAGLLIAAAPAVVTPLTQQDMRVVADTEVTLTASPLQQLIDAYLTGIIPGTPDNTETSVNGLLGVLQVLTQPGGDFLQLPIINAYIGGGPSGAANGILGVLDLLTAPGGLFANDIANAYISGGSNGGANGILGVLDLETQPGGLFANDVANAYIAGGPSGASNGILGVLDLETAPGGLFANEIANAYISGGSNDGQNGILGVADLLTTGVPVVNSYITGGLSGVADELLPASAFPLVNAYLVGSDTRVNGILGVAEVLTADLPFVNAYIAGYPSGGPNGLIAVTQRVIDTILGSPEGAAATTLAPATLRAAQNVPEVESEEGGGSVALATEGGGGTSEVGGPLTKLLTPKLGSKSSAPTISPLAAVDPVDAPEASDTDLPGPADLPTPVKKLADKSDDGDGGKGLVRDSKKFTPEVILPFGTTGGGGSDDWAGKRFVNQLKEAFSGSKGGDASSDGGGASEK